MTVKFRRNLDSVWMGSGREGSMVILVSIQEFVGYGTRMVILVCSHCEYDADHGISCEWLLFLVRRSNGTRGDCVQQVC